MPDENIQLNKDNTHNNYSGIEELLNANKEQSLQQQFERDAMTRGVIMPSDYMTKYEPVHGNIPYEYGSYVPHAQLSEGGLEVLDEMRAQNQGAGTQWLHGATKFVGKTLTNVAGGLAMIPAAIWQGAKAITGAAGISEGGSLSAIYNNGFQQWLDKANEGMDYYMPNYYTREQQKQSLMKDVFSANFWANDMLGGLSFIAGAVLTDGLATGALAAAGIGRAIGGTARAIGNAVRKAKTNKLLNEGIESAATQVMQGYKNASGIPTAIERLGSLGRQMVTGSGYEAGVEARHFLKEAVAHKAMELERLKGRRLTEQELLEVEAELSGIANGVFGLNFGLVSVSNMIGLPRMFGIKMSNVGKTLGITSRNPIQSTVGMAWNKGMNDIAAAMKIAPGFKEFAKKYLKPAGQIAWEGIVEEGGQSVIQNTALHYAAQKYSPFAHQSTYDLMDSFMNGLNQTFGSKDGWKEMLIGMMLSGIGAPHISFDQYKEKGIKSVFSFQGVIADAFRESKDRMSEAENIIKRNQQANITPIMQAMWGNLASQYHTQQQLDNAVMSGNMYGAKTAEHEALFSHVVARMEAGFEGEIGNEIADSVKNMSNEEFASVFGYDNMSEQEIAERKDNVVKSTKQLAKSIEDKVRLANDFLYKQGVEDKETTIGLAYNMSMSDNLDKRRKELISELNSKLREKGFTDGESGALQTIRNIEKGIQDTEGAISRLKDQLEDSTGYDDMLSQEMNNIGAELFKAEQALDFEKGLSTTSPERIQELENTVGAIKQRQAAIEQQRASLSKGKKAMSRELESIDKKIDIYNKKSKQSPIDETEKKELDELNKQRKEAEAKVKAEETRRKKVEDEITALKQQVSNQQREIQEAQRVKAVGLSDNMKLNDMASALDKLSLNPALADEIRSIFDDISKIDNHRSALVNEYLALTSKEGRLAFKEGIKSIRQAISKIFGENEEEGQLIDMVIASVNDSMQRRGYTLKDLALNRAKIKGKSLISSTDEGSKNETALSNASEEVLKLPSILSEKLKVAKYESLRRKIEKLYKEIGQIYKDDAPYKEKMSYHSKALQIIDKAISIVSPLENDATWSSTEDKQIVSSFLSVLNDAKTKHSKILNEYKVKHRQQLIDKGGNIIFSHRELLKMFSDPAFVTPEGYEAINAMTNMSNDEIANIFNNGNKAGFITLEVRPYDKAGNKSKAKGNDTVDVELGASGTNVGVYAVFNKPDGSKVVIGGLLDPRRFSVEGMQLNLEDNMDLKLLNRAFVDDDGYPTREGVAARVYWRHLNKIWDTVFSDKASLNTEEGRLEASNKLQSMMTLHKTDYVIPIKMLFEGSKYKEGFANNENLPTVKDIYTTDNAVTLPNGNKGIIIVRTLKDGTRVDYFIRRVGTDGKLNDSFEPVKENSEIKAIQDIASGTNQSKLTGAFSAIINSNGGNHAISLSELSYEEREKKGLLQDAKRGDVNTSMRNNAVDIMEIYNKYIEQHKKKGLKGTALITAVRDSLTKDEKALKTVLGQNREMGDTKIYISANIQGYQVTVAVGVKLFGDNVLPTLELQIQQFGKKGTIYIPLDVTYKVGADGKGRFKKVYHSKGDLQGYKEGHEVALSIESINELLSPKEDGTQSFPLQSATKDTLSTVDKLLSDIGMSSANSMDELLEAQSRGTYGKMKKMSNTQLTSLANAIDLMSAVNAIQELQLFNVKQTTRTLADLMELKSNALVGSNIEFHPKSLDAEDLINKELDKVKQQKKDDIKAKQNAAKQQASNAVAGVNNTNTSANSFIVKGEDGVSRTKVGDVFESSSVLHIRLDKLFNAIRTKDDAAIKEVLDVIMEESSSGEVFNMKEIILIKMLMKKYRGEEFSKAILDAAQKDYVGKSLIEIYDVDTQYAKLKADNNDNKKKKRSTLRNYADRVIEVTRSNKLGSELFKKTLGSNIRKVEGFYMSEDEQLYDADYLPWTESEINTIYDSITASPSQKSTTTTSQQDNINIGAISKDGKIRSNSVNVSDANTVFKATVISRDANGNPTEISVIPNDISRAVSAWSEYVTPLYEKEGDKIEQEDHKNIEFKGALFEVDGKGFKLKTRGKVKLKDAVIKQRDKDNKSQQSPADDSKKAPQQDAYNEQKFTQYVIDNIATFTNNSGIISDRSIADKMADSGYVGTLPSARQVKVIVKALKDASIIDDAGNLIEPLSKEPDIKQQGEVTDAHELEATEEDDVVFSMSDSNTVVDTNESQDVIMRRMLTSLSRILPIGSAIDVKDINVLLNNMKNKGVTFGAFLNGVIYLNTKKDLPSGIEYHEAFHAVFRMFLDNKEIEKYYTLAKTRWGTPSNADITLLRSKSSSYANLSKDKLVYLWYEEKMADAFQEYAVEKEGIAFGAITQAERGIIKAVEQAGSVENYIMSLYTKGMSPAQRALWRKNSYDYHYTNIAKQYYEAWNKLQKGYAYAASLENRNEQSKEASKSSMWRKLWNKIKSWFSWHTSYRDENTVIQDGLSHLFRDVFVGKYKDAEPKYPIFANSNKPAFSILPSSKVNLINADRSGSSDIERTFLSNKVSEAIINTITLRVFKAAQSAMSGRYTNDMIVSEMLSFADDIKKAFSYQDQDGVIHEGFTLKASRLLAYNYAETNTSESLSDDEYDREFSINRDKMLDIITKYSEMYQSIVGTTTYKSGVKVRTNEQRIIEEVMRRLKIYDIGEIEVEDEYDNIEDDASESNRWDLSIHQIGGFGSMSKEMKQYMASAESFIDMFGIGVESEKELSKYIGVHLNDKERGVPFNLSSDAFTIYNGLERTLSGVQRENMLSRAYHYALGNKHAKSFIDRMMTDIRKEIAGEYLKRYEEVRSGVLNGRYTDAESMERYAMELYNKASGINNMDNRSLLDLDINTLSLSTFFNRFISTFRKDTNKFFSTLYSTENGKIKTLMSNQKDIHHQQFESWSKAYRATRGTAAQRNEAMRDAIESLNIIQSGNDLFAGTNDSAFDGANSLDDVISQIYDKLLSVGINISPLYIKFSYLYNNRDILMQKVQDSSNTQYYIDMVRFLDSFSVDGMQIIDSEWLSGVMSAVNSVRPGEELGIFVERVAGEGAIGRLQAIASANSFFDESVGKSTFSNIEGKSVYDKVLPYHYSETAAELRDKKRREFAILYRQGDIDGAMNSLRDAMIASNTYRGEYLFQEYFHAVKNNPMLQGMTSGKGGIIYSEQLADVIFDNLTLGVMDGLRSEAMDDDGNKKYSMLSTQGSSFKKLDMRGKALESMLLFAESGSSTNTKYLPQDADYIAIGKDTSKQVQFRHFVLGVFETKNTILSAEMPVSMFYSNGKPTTLAIQYMRRFYNMEAERIVRVNQQLKKLVEEINSTGTISSIGDTLIEGYHYVVDKATGNKVITYYDNGWQHYVLNEQYAFQNYDMKEHYSYSVQQTSNGKTPKSLEFFHFKAMKDNNIEQVQQGNISTNVDSAIENFLTEQYNAFVEHIASESIRIIRKERIASRDVLFNAIKDNASRVSKETYEELSRYMDAVLENKAKEKQSLDYEEEDDNYDISAINRMLNFAIGGKQFKKDRKTIKTILKQLLKDTGAYINELLPPMYEGANGYVNRDEVGNYFMNDYLNTLAFTTVMDGDLSVTHENSIDVVKRNGGKIGNGTSTGYGQFKAASVKSIKKDIEALDKIRTGIKDRTSLGGENKDTPDIDTTDAQSLCTPKFYINNFLTSLGRVNSTVRAILRKIQRGIKLNRHEQEVLSFNKATWQPRKLVYVDREFYIKTSTQPLFREMVSTVNHQYLYAVSKNEGLNYYKMSPEEKEIYANRKINEMYDNIERIQAELDIAEGDVHETKYNTLLKMKQELYGTFNVNTKSFDGGLFIAIPGRERLHNLLTQMELQDTDFVAYDSAYKRAKVNNGRYNEQSGIWELHNHTLDSKFMREQVNTDGFKEEIIDGTQLIQLVWSEQDMNVDVVINGAKTKMRNAVDMYERLLSERVDDGYAMKRTNIFKNFERNGRMSEQDFQEMYDVFKESLEAGGADPYLMELFKVDEYGKPVYNWNFPAVMAKFEAMYLAYISKDTLKHKVSGRKYTLLSDNGFNIVRPIISVLSQEQVSSIVSGGSIKGKSKYILNEAPHFNAIINDFDIDGIISSSYVKDGDAEVIKLTSKVPYEQHGKLLSSDALLLEFLYNQSKEVKKYVDDIIDMSSGSYTLQDVIESDGKYYITGAPVPADTVSKNPDRYNNKDRYIKSRLRHRVKQSDGRYFSEALVSRKALKDLGDIVVGDTLEIPAHIAQQLGVRIPTQDKHSMVTLKIIDVLPEQCGNSIVLPYENVYLSGADFDIDALYTQIYEVYMKKRYGHYLSIDDKENRMKRAMEEWVSSMKSNRKLNDTIKSLLNVSLKPLNDEMRDITISIGEKKELIKGYVENSYMTADDIVSSIREKVREGVKNIIDANYSALSKEYDSLIEDLYNDDSMSFSDIGTMRYALKQQYRDKRKELSASIKQQYDTIRKEYIKTLSIQEQEILYIQDDIYSLISRSKEIKLERDAVKADVLTKALKALSMPSNIDEFKATYEKQVEDNYNAFKQSKLESYKPLTQQERNNAILDIKMQFVHNDGNKSISATPAEMTPFFDLEDRLFKELGIPNPDTTIGVNSPLDKNKAFNANDIGKTNIGVAALFNVAFQRLSSKNIQIRMRDMEGNLQSIIGKTGFNTMMSDDNKRINDYISSFVSAMTDTAKYRHAAKFNLTLDTLGAAMTGVGLGLPFNKVVMLMMQPAVKTVSDRLTLKKTEIKTRQEQQFHDRQSLKDIIINTMTDMAIEPDMIPQDVTVEQLEDVLKNGEQSQYYDIVQAFALQEFYKMKQVGDAIRNLTTVMSLIKGVKSSFTETRQVYEALKMLGIEIVPKKGVDTNKSMSSDDYELRHTSEFNGDTLGKDYAIDALPILNSPFMKSQIINFHLIMGDSSRMFILNTDYSVSMLEAAQYNGNPKSMGFKEVYGRTRRHLISFYAMKSYLNLMEKAGHKVDVSLDMLKSDELHQMVLELLDTDEHRDNMLLKFINSEEREYNREDSIFYGETLSYLYGNTRTKHDPDYVQALTDSYNILKQSGGRAAEFAEKLKLYILIKDNLAFNNNSLVRQISPVVLKPVMKALDMVQALLSGEKSFNGKAISFESVFGMSEENLRHEFLSLYLPYMDNTYNLRTMTERAYKSKAYALKSSAESTSAKSQENKEKADKEQLLNEGWTEQQIKETYGIGEDDSNAIDDIDDELKSKPKFSKMDFPLFMDYREGTLHVNAMAKAAGQKGVYSRNVQGLANTNLFSKVSSGNSVTLLFPQYVRISNDDGYKLKKLNFVKQWVTTPKGDKMYVGIRPDGTIASMYIKGQKMTKEKFESEYKGKSVFEVMDNLGVSREQYYMYGTFTGFQAVYTHTYQIGSREIMPYAFTKEQWLEQYHFNQQVRRNMIESKEDIDTDINSTIDEDESNNVSNSMPVEESTSKPLLDLASKFQEIGSLHEIEGIELKYSGGYKTTDDVNNAINKRAKGNIITISNGKVDDNVSDDATDINVVTDGTMSVEVNRTIKKHIEAGRRVLLSNNKKNASLAILAYAITMNTEKGKDAPYSQLMLFHTGNKPSKIGVIDAQKELKQKAPIDDAMFEKEMSKRNANISTLRKMLASEKKDSEKLKTEYHIQQAIKRKESLSSIPKSSPASRKQLDDILSRLFNRFGIQYKYDTSIGALGMFKAGTVYINPDMATLDTPFHEYAHPFIIALRTENPMLYNAIVKEVKEKYQYIIDSKYKEYIGEGLTQQEIIEEAIVSLLGLYAADTYLRGEDSLMPKETKSLLRRLLDWIASLFTGAYRAVADSPNISASTTIQQLGSMIGSFEQFTVTPQLLHTNILEHC